MILGAVFISNSTDSINVQTQVSNAVEKMFAILMLMIYNHHLPWQSILFVTTCNRQAYNPNALRLYAWWLHVDATATISVWMKHCTNKFIGAVKLLCLQCLLDNNIGHMRSKITKMIIVIVMISNDHRTMFFDIQFNAKGKISFSGIIISENNN